VGNKVDLKEKGKGVTREEINKYLSGHKKWEYLECSAKENLNVKNIFQRVAVMLREQEREKEKMAQNSKMKIHPSKLRKTNDGGSCC
jgi:GTPase SAR1 family protein